MTIERDEHGSSLTSLLAILPEAATRNEAARLAYLAGCADTLKKAAKIGGGAVFLLAASIGEKAVEIAASKVAAKYATPATEAAANATS